MSTANTVASLCGWQENPAGIAACAAENGQLSKVASNLIGGEQRDCFLWQALLKQKPTWRRGAQGIGDCFHPDTIVFGANDSKPISAVNIGEQIYDGDGRLATVISKQVKVSSQPLVTIHATGGVPLRVTADHRVLVYRLGMYGPKKRVTKALYNRVNKGERSRGPSAVVAAYEGRKSEWITAGELRNGDFLLTPLGVTQQDAPQHPLTSSDDAMWLLGYFLGDGCASGGSVEFAISDDAIYQRIWSTLSALGYRPKGSEYRKGCGAVRIRVHNAELVRWLRSMCYGHDKLKVMPSWAVGNRHVVAGLIDADGHRKGSKETFDSVSPSLAYGVQMSQIMLGNDATITTVSRSAGSYANSRVSYRVVSKSDRLRERVWRDEQYLCRPVCKVEISEGPHEVYDIGVDSKSHCFIANGYVAHNCVSWGAELCATMLMAIESIEGKMQWSGEAATEPIYGGCRVEALDKKSGGWSDGAFGYAAAHWLRDFGVLLRTDYSGKTNNSEHNLTKYDKKKAKDWGNYGCGGQNDKGSLDALARVHPIKHVTGIKTVEEAAAALQNGYPVSIASMAGFGDMRRDANGLCYWTGQWAHQMMLGGIRWRNGKMETRCFQSWGDSCSGPDPGIEDSLPKFIRAAGGDGAFEGTPYGISDQQAFKKRLILPYEDFPFQSVEVEAWNPISACSWWIDEKTLARILSSGDCWTFSGVGGFAPRKLDVLGSVLSWTDGL